MQGPLCAVDIDRALSATEGIACNAVEVMHDLDVMSCSCCPLPGMPLTGKRRYCKRRYCKPAFTGCE